MMSSVYITKSILSFKREKASLEGFQVRARIQKQKMLKPVVKLSYLIQEFIGDSTEPYYTSLSTATGFGVEYNPKNNTSYVITNAHFCDIVAEDSSAKLIAETAEHFRHGYPGSDGIPGDALYSDRTLDLCMVAIYGFIAPTKLASPGYEAQQFENIFIVGAPSGVLPIIIDTYLSADIDRGMIDLGIMSKSGNNYILVSEQVFPGHSGSPIYNDGGEVIGVIFASMSHYGGIGIPIKDVYSFMQDFYKATSD